MSNITTTYEPIAARGLGMSAFPSIVASPLAAARVRGGLTVDLCGDKATSATTVGFGRRLGPSTWSPPIT